MDLLAQRSVTLASSWSEKMKSRKARSKRAGAVKAASADSMLESNDLS